MPDIYAYRAHVVSVYDGDTVTAVVDLGFHVSQEMTLRLCGIDTPEVRGEERPQGIVARDRLRELILDKDVVIRTKKDKREKYGRYLATVYVNGVDVNALLVDEGLAEQYMV